MSEEKKIEDVLNLLNILSEKIDAQGKRIEKLENFSIVKTENISVPIPPPPAPRNEPAQPINEAGLEKFLKTSDEKLAKKESSVEEKIGGKWFARIGMAALVLGVSFFLKYAFDNNWIGETGRVIIGIFIGLALLGMGERYIRKYFVYGQIISGGGIAILYLSIFSAFNFYHLLDQIPAFFAMIFITSIGIILSLRYNAISLIIVSIFGGFVTPFLISTGQNNQVGLLSYILILDMAILVVSIFKKWRALNFLGFFGTGLVFSFWAEKFYSEEALGLTMFFLSAFFIVYSISSLIYNLTKKEESSIVEQLLTLLSAIFYFGVSYALLNRNYHIYMGFFALILAIYYFLWAYLVKTLTPKDKNLYNFLAFLTVGFISLAIPIQFEGNVIAIGWLIEAMILSLLGLKMQNSGVKYFGFIILVLSLTRLLFFDSDYSKDDLLIFNKIFGTFLFAVLILYLIAYLFKIIGNEEEKNNFSGMKSTIIILVIMANFLTVFAVSREINFYYESQIKQIKALKKEKSAYVYGNDDSIIARTNYTDKIKKVRSRNSVALSIFWLLYSIIILTAGIVKKWKFLRLGGLVLLMAAILKLFFYDLWSLGTLYRIISSISLGVVLLSISFVYQKYKDKIKEII